MLPYILSFLTILGFVALVFFRPTVETYVLYALFTIPFVDLKIVPSYYGGFKAFDIISYLALIILFNDFIAIKGRFRDSFYFLLSILFIFITILGKIYSEFLADGIFTILQLFPIFIFTRFLIIYCSNDIYNRFKIFNALKTGFALALGFMLLQMGFGLGFSFYDGLNPNTFNETSGIVRYPGFFDDSQVNGQYLAMGSFIFLIMQDKISKMAQNINYSLFVLTIIGILLAGSRSPLGGFLVGCALLVFFAGKRIRMYAIAMGIVGAITFLILAPQLDIFNRSKNLSDDFLFRESIWEETIDIVKENPFLGIGIGNFENYTTKYNQNLYLEIETGEILFFDQPENGYLKILVEHGVLVFAIFLLFLLLPLTKNLISYRHKENQWVVFIMASFVSWLVSFSTVYSISDYRLLIVVGTCISLLIISSKNHYSKTREGELYTN